ncbi:MAG: complex I NDUFA9 subunit family protein [Gemmatimonadetes bacterium]|nr:complex I NDUFA9 subunit family protein [Gemmatimonadota bacterium]MBT8479271.1 complex I NDUFA9 subunit family protein [Gemmatimonadota bacterium]NNK48343.1 complex I NDUFA9 subunit family protein [Gemmatimonadota bacterium]
MASGSARADPGDSGPFGGVAECEQLDPIDAAVTPSRRVLVTGASGFIAGHLLPRLASRGHRVRAMWRGRDGPGRSSAPGVDWVEADVTRPDSLDRAVLECDVVVHLAGCSAAEPGGSLERINVVGTRNLLVAALDARVQRIVYISALGASPAAGPYFRSRFQAEDAVMSSGLEHVILRPAVVYGPSDHFVTAILAVLRKFPVFPMLGDGTFKLQPVAVEDMVDALTQSVERPDVEGGLYEVAGPDRMSFVSIVRTVGEVSGLRRPILPLPDAVASPVTRLARSAGFATPFTREQLDVLRRGSVLSGEDNPLQSVFRVKPLPFRDALEDYLSSEPTGLAGDTGPGGATCP